MYVKIKKSNIEKIRILKTDCRMTLAQVVAQYKPDFVINGGLYNTLTKKVNKIPLRIDGETIATSKDGYWVYAWNDGPDIKMVHSADMDLYKNVIACSTMLKNGGNTIFSYTKAQDGIRGRTAIGTDVDEITLFATTDKEGALAPKDLRNKMRLYECQDAIMLDCGGSSQGYFNGKYVQYEKRKVSYWIGIWCKKTTVDADTSKNPSVCPFKAPVANVYVGGRGESVKWIQWHLNAAMGCKLTVDGMFGNGTWTAVKNFQRKYGLVADGVVGKMTREKMKEVVE